MMDTISELDCNDLEAMEQAAKQFALPLSAPLVITFEGPLGAGKTTFIQGMLKAWGYKDAVTSPTFSLVHEYTDLTDQQGKAFNVAHFDLYRLNDPLELEDIGFRDYLDRQTICLIEWPSKAKDILPQADYHLKLSLKEHGRHLHILSHSHAATKS